MTRSCPIALGAALVLAGCGHREDVASTPAPAAAVTPASPPAAASAQTLPALIVATPELSTLARALTASGVGATLGAGGPYTVFAPTDAAFSRLAPGTVDSLLKAENRTSLSRLLTYYLVPGVVSSAELSRRIAAGGGTASIATVEGDPLTASMAGSVIMLTDVNGNRSYIESADRPAANGVVHIVNGVLVPHLG